MDKECAKCGIKVAQDAKFCHICGGSVQEQVDDKQTSEKIKSLPVQMTVEQFEEYSRELLKNAFDEMGLTKVDRKHLAAPGMTDNDVDSLTPKQKVAKMIKHMVDGDMVAAKALSEGTDSAGGFLTPPGFRAEVVKALEKPGMIRNLVRVIPVGTDGGNIPTLSGNVTVQWGSENTTITPSDPTFGTLAWSINRLDGLNESSRELFADSAINLADFITMLFVEAFAREDRNVFITGSGTGQPEGLQNASGLTAYAQAGANLAGDDIVNIYHALPSQYRARGVWFIHDDILELVSKLKDNDGRYLVANSLREGEPMTLKGRPVIENEFIPTDLGGGNDESLIFFCDPMWFYLFDREQMGVESTTVGGDAFKKHQVHTKVFQRLDGKVALGEAFVKATGIK